MKERTYPEIRSLEEAASVRGPVLHPLAGSSFGNFVEQFSRHRNYSSRSGLQRLITSLALLERWPLSQFEAWKWGASIRSHEPPHPPVFIIGHWGSGTTYLHYLLSRDPGFGFLDFGNALMPWNLFGTSRYCRCFVRPLVPTERLYDSVRISLEEPQEEEMALAAMNPISYFNAFYFPRELTAHTRHSLFPETAPEGDRIEFEMAYQLLVKRLSLRHGGRRLLFKNPASTTRMPMLRRLFPGAKFIHLVRNPFDVFASGMNRLPYLFNRFALQDFQDLDLHSYTLGTYRSVMHRYLRDRDEMAPDELCEVRFEDLAANPLKEIERVYTDLVLPGKSAALSAIADHLQKCSPHVHSPRSLTPFQAEAVSNEWGFFCGNWNYPAKADSGRIARNV